MKRIIIPVVAVACMFAVPSARAQDPVKVDAKHYKVEFENDAVRILRIHYGPGEKSVMHDHPDAVVIYLTDLETKMTFPDGKTQVNNGKAGEVLATPGGPHLPENTGGKSMELILVEFKGKAAQKLVAPTNAKVTGSVN